METTFRRRTPLSAHSRHYLALGPHCYGTGSTPEEALTKCRNHLLAHLEPPITATIYEASKSTSVRYNGILEWDSDDDPPEEVTEAYLAFPDENGLDAFDAIENLLDDLSHYITSLRIALLEEDETEVDQLRSLIDGALDDLHRV